MPVGEYGTIAAALTEHLSEATHGWTDRFVSASHILERTNEGKLAKDMFQNHYFPLVSQAAELQAKNAHDAIKTGQVTGKVDVGAIMGNAQKFARNSVAGPKDANFVALVKSVHDRHGQLAAESLSNTISFLLKDYSNPSIGLNKVLQDKNASAKDIKNYLNRTGGMGEYSPFKKNVMAAGVPLPNRGTKPEYHPVSRTESAILGTLNATFAPMVVIPHIGTVFNGMLGTTPDKFLKGVAGAMHFSLSQEIDKHEAMMITGAYAEHHLNALREWNYFKATGVPQWRQGPTIKGYSAAHLAYKALHQPGFRPLRDYTLLSGVGVAQATVTDLATKLAKDPKNPRLIYMATKWGLDPNDMVKQNGVLNTGQLERAIYSYVDNHYFINNAMHRSAFFQGTSTGRILGMYHSYVTRQAKLMAKSLADVHRGQGMIATARNLAVMATLFPVVGEIIKLTQMGVRGQDAVGQAQTDLENISGQGENGLYDSAGTYFEALGHMGSFGIYNHLLRGGYTHSLINEAAGPTINSASNLGQDTLNLIKHRQSEDYDDVEGGFEASKPVLRDLTYDTPGISTLAYVLNHRFLPKASEDPDNDPAKQLYNWFQSAKDEKPKQNEANAKEN